MWSSDIDYLFKHIGEDVWAKAELAERLDDESYDLNPGQAYLFRQDLWNQFLDKDGKFDYTYPERIFKNNYLQNIITLLKEDNDTRKAVLSIFDATIDSIRLDGSKRIPCSMYYDFLIRENAKGEKQLNICYHQRSSDFVTHFGNDVFLAWGLMEYVAEKVGVKPVNL